MSKITFGTNIIPDVTQNAFVVFIRATTKGKGELLKELSESLLFPDYFGNNWDALRDCLSDLTWISEKKIIIVFESISQLDYMTQEVLIEILDDVVQFWNTNSDLHDIEIIVIN